MSDGEREKAELFLLACARGFLVDAEQLIAEGVQPGTADRNRRSGAHFAAAHGEVEVLRLLRSRGVDLDADDASGRAPLHYAAAADADAAVRFLLEDAGAWADAMDGEDCTPLHRAAIAGAAAAAARLLAAGAKPRLRNAWGLTPLGDAAVSGSAGVCAALAKAGAASGADVMARGRGGFTLLHLAAGAGEAASVEWLLGRRGDGGGDGGGVSAAPRAAAVNDAENADALTPLHCAVYGGSEAVVRALATAGASTSARNARGRTATQLCADEVADRGAAERLCAAMGVAALPEGGEATAVAQASTPRSLVPARGSQLRAAPAASGAGGARGGAAAAPKLDADVSPAARLQAAQSPADAAAVLRAMAPDHRALRMRLWAEQPRRELEALPYLTARAKEAIEKVTKLRALQARVVAENALRQDETFQMDMRDPEVRNAVDTVIANPAAGTALRPASPALACLVKLRGLRDALRRGGAPETIGLGAVLEPWTDEDSRRTRELDEVVARATEEAIAVVMYPSDGTGADVAQRDSPGDVAQRDSPAADAAGAHAVEGSSRGEGSARNVWRDLRTRVLQQLAIALAAVVVMWLMGRLPHQQAKRLADLQAAETSALDRRVGLSESEQEQAALQEAGL